MLSFNVFFAFFAFFAIASALPIDGIPDVGAPDLGGIGGGVGGGNPTEVLDALIKTLTAFLEGFKAGLPVTVPSVTGAPTLPVTIPEVTLPTLPTVPSV